MIDKRLMYAQGQRVAKTLNGSRPGYAGPNEPNDGQGVGASTSSRSNRENYRTSQYTAPKAQVETTVTSPMKNRETGEDIPDYDITRDKRYSPKSKIGFGPKGKDTFHEAQIKNMKQGLREVNPGFFDSGLGKFIKGLGKTALMAYGPVAFGPRFATGAKVYKTAKIAKDFLDKATVGTSLTNLFNNNKTLNNKSIKSVSKIGTDKTKFGGDGQNGIAGLEAMSLLENEYILLLQKLQAGSISENDKSRFGVLKQMLGK